jgi:anaerobic C4-dicarboxylate transporter
VLFLVSKLVNSQAAALTAVAPMGLMLGIDPKMLIAFFPASYGYFVLPTYRLIWPVSDLTVQELRVLAGLSLTTASYYRG